MGLIRECFLEEVTLDQSEIWARPKEGMRMRRISRKRFNIIQLKINLIDWALSGCP